MYHARVPGASHSVPATAINPDRVSGTLGAAAHGASQLVGHRQTRQEVPYYTLILPKIPCRSCATMLPCAPSIQTGMSWEPLAHRNCLMGVPLA